MGGSATLRWEWHGGGKAEGRGSVGAQRDSSNFALRCAQEEGRFPNRPYGNDGWERFAALGMTCGEGEGRFPNRPYGNDGWERCAAVGHDDVESGGNDTTRGLIYLSYSFPGVRAWS